MKYNILFSANKVCALSLTLAYLDFCIAQEFIINSRKVEQKKREVSKYLYKEEIVGRFCSSFVL